MGNIWMPPDPDPIVGVRSVLDSLVPSEQSSIILSLRVLAQFNRRMAVELLVKDGKKRRVAKRQVSRMLKTERLRQKRTRR
jgi:hypothetical protein